MSSSVVSTLFYQRLLDDHDETKTILETLSVLLQSDDLIAFKKLFEDLRQALKRHYACEEHALFAVLNQYRTMVLMEKEHDDLLLQELAIADALDHGEDRNVIESAFAIFKERLNAHIVEENDGIFPMAEKLLEPEEKMLVARKIAEVYVQFLNTAAEDIPLERPTPGFKIGKIADPSNKPIAYDKLFEFDHTLVQHVSMKASSKTQDHWSGQVICLTMLQGEALFETADGKSSQVLAQGSYLTIEPHLLFRLTAQTDCRYMLFKVWPKPHFLR